MGDKNKLRSSHFKKSKPTIVYIHGFTESTNGGEGLSGHEIRDGTYLIRGAENAVFLNLFFFIYTAFLKVKDSNVILVDYSPLAAMPWYSSAVRNSPRVGRYVARFLRFLIKQDVQLSSIHLIGFSLGAAVAGCTGKIMKEYKMMLPRITG